MHLPAMGVREDTHYVHQRLPDYEFFSLLVIFHNLEICVMCNKIDFSSKTHNILTQFLPDYFPGEWVCVTREVVITEATAARIIRVVTVQSSRGRTVLARSGHVRRKRAE